MFEQIGGLYLHPLIVHAPVVLVLGLALVSLLYALFELESLLMWPLITLAVLAPVFSGLAIISGYALSGARYGSQLPNEVQNHASLGITVGVISGACSVAALLLLVARRRDVHPGVELIGIVAVIALSLASFMYVILAGHSGAEFVWKVV